MTSVTCSAYVIGSRVKATVAQCQRVTSQNVIPVQCTMTFCSASGRQITAPQMDSLSTRVVKCSLDEDQCLSLHDILTSFQTAINEEQAWALCYQTVKCFAQHYQSSHCFPINDPTQLSIHKDGYVHSKSILSKEVKSTSREDKRSQSAITSSHKMLTSLGIVLFHALDYGLCDDEERTLSKPLELLIEKLTTAHEIARRHRKSRPTRSTNEQQQQQGEMHSLGSVYDDNDQADEDELEDECANTDEGIERDCIEDGESHGSPSMCSELVNFDQVIQMCVSRLSSRESADNHYKAVCRALIAETLELSTFLDQIAKGANELRKSSVVNIQSSSYQESEATLEKLQFHDWARLWIQVIRELRHGVKLKKVDQEDMIHNTEYELTPYEMLLDDIRSRRYKLNKVMINGDLPPRVKKDAHELILDFIRSRPPLVPVSKRVLKPPPPKQVTLYERLMESIRQEHKLKPTPRPRSVYSFSAHTTPMHNSAVTEDGAITPESMSAQMQLSPNSANQASTRRKLIKANIKLDLSLEDEDSDEDEFIRVETTSHEQPVRPVSAYFSSSLEMQNSKENLFNENNAKLEEHVSNENKSLENGNLNSSDGIRRFKRFSNRLFSRERRHSISVFDSNLLQQHHSPSDIIEDLDFEEDARNHVATIWESTELGKSLECLSLTLKEVQHIRSVLTKAEIESLGVTKSLKTDLENGKICFTCLKTRFTFWGPWATVCKLCNRAICERCATKMSIPTEQFERVPIYMLSPTPSPPNEKNHAEIFNWTKMISSGTTERENDTEPTSLPSKMNFSRGRMSRLVRMLTSHHQDDNQLEQQEENFNSKHCHSGPLVKVCRDCKILVRHLIDIGHTNFGATAIRTGKT